MYIFLPIDLAHEQNNKRVTGDGGAIGLTKDSSHLLHGCLLVLKLPALLVNFEKSMLKSSVEVFSAVYRHHHQMLIVQ